MQTKRIRPNKCGAPIWRALLTGVLLMLSTACSDRSQTSGSVTTDGLTGPSAEKRAAEPQSESFYIKQKKNGKNKAYRVKVDKARGILELETVTAMSEPVDWCEPDDPSCVSGNCEITDPTCGRMYGEEEISGQTNVYYNTGEPAYDLAEGEYGPYYCPKYIDDPHFVWRGHHFEIDGRVYMQAGVILPSPSGLPRARYVLPSGPWYSTMVRQ